MEKSIILKIIPIYETGETSAQHITSYIRSLVTYYKWVYIRAQLLSQKFHVSNNPNTTAHEAQHMILDNVVCNPSPNTILSIRVPLMRLTLFRRCLSAGASHSASHRHPNVVGVWLISLSRWSLVCAAATVESNVIGPSLLAARRLVSSLLLCILDMCASNTGTDLHTQL